MSRPLLPLAHTSHTSHISHTCRSWGLYRIVERPHCRWLGRLLAAVSLAMAMLAVTGAAQAADVSKKDAVNIRAVVQAQLDALAVDDADRAFSFAAPSIRKMMGNAQNFLAMVRTGYPVVHRPASVTFLLPELRGAEMIQAVQMTDAKGVAWLALYNLQRQPNKAWRISGCVVVPNEGRAV